MAGYVKLYRQMREWEWYKDQHTKDVFLHCLLCANHRPAKWQGIVVETGSFITSTPKLSKETGISRQCVRTSLNRLKSTNELTIESTNKYTIITIVKWDDYQGFDEEVNQDINQPTNKQLTNDQPATNQQLTTNKKYKKYKNEKNNTYKDICQRVIENLNWQTGRKFKTVESNTKHIIARLKEGYSEEECIRVVHNKVIDWLDNPDMKDFLRPSTLFGTKFDGYLQGNDQSGMRTNAEIEKIIKESDNPHE